MSPLLQASSLLLTGTEGIFTWIPSSETVLLNFILCFFPWMFVFAFNYALFQSVFHKKRRFLVSPRNRCWGWHRFHQAALAAFPSSPKPSPHGAEAAFSCHLPHWQKVWSQISSICEVVTTSLWCAVLAPEACALHLTQLVDRQLRQAFGLCWHRNKPWCWIPAKLCVWNLLNIRVFFMA